MRTPLIDRRVFLAGAGATLYGLLTNRAADAATQADALFASGYRAPNGEFGVATLTESGKVLHTYRLPSRGHDLIARPLSQSIVTFARRPGTFAAVIDRSSHDQPLVFACPTDRHFYGHGAFSADGRLLYTTENDFEAARGVIGIYDATDGYVRVGELPSGGVGPHDMLLMPDRRTLVIANGGIETHPGYPRAKLNIPSMAPNLAFVDTATGEVLHTATLPPDSHKLSIRHLAIQADGTTWFACQNEGDSVEPVSLAGKIRRDGDIQMLNLDVREWGSLRGYIGAIACSPDGARVVITSPRGGVALDIDSAKNSVTRSVAQADICGVAMRDRDVFLTSGTGKAQSRIHELSFDNHVALIG